MRVDDLHHEEGGDAARILEDRCLGEGHAACHLLGHGRHVLTLRTKEQTTMIWVIGDIHGMLDPLKRLMTKLMDLHYSGAEGFEIERLIFIGDYIDYGPSSKEVVDLLIDLPFDKVFLMGNHEDLLLQFVKRSDLFEEHGNVWFRGSGGQQTVMSFFPQLACSEEEDDRGRGSTATTRSSTGTCRRPISKRTGTTSTATIPRWRSRA